MKAPRQNEDDSELVSEALAGDPRAQRRLVELLSRRVRAIALSIVGNPTDADDATQVIFMELLRSLGTFSGGKLISWADKIAVRTAARLERRRRRHGARDVGVDPAELPAELAPSFEPAPLRPMGEYLAGLSETRRITLVLRHVMGYSVEEIAAITEVPANTVKDRLVRARAHVRKNVRRGLRSNSSRPRP